MSVSSSKIVQIILQFLAILILSVSFALAQQSSELVTKTEQTQINSISLMSPPAVEQPLVIDADFQLQAINNIDDKDEAFEFVGVLTLKWKDQRLSFDPAYEQVSEKIYQGDYQINQVFNGWSPQPVLLNQSGLYETSAELLRVQPDGTVTFSQMMNAIAEVSLSMRRMPFDHQHLEAVFGIFGFDKSKIVLRVDPDQLNLSKKPISIDQWILKDTKFLTRDSQISKVGNKTLSSFVVSLEVKRDSFFMVRLIIFPLAFIVMLIWSVFWIDRASMGDRINICFVGILTAVAYQIVLGDRLPQISYVTFITGFINISFLMMSATILVNLVIGSLDKAGNVLRADRIERRSRWVFPITYLGLVLLALVAAFIFFD